MAFFEQAVVGEPGFGFSQLQVRLECFIILQRARSLVLLKRIEHHGDEMRVRLRHQHCVGSVGPFLNEVGHDGQLNKIRAAEGQPLPGSEVGVSFEFRVHDGADLGGKCLDGSVRHVRVTGAEPVPIQGQEIVPVHLVHAGSARGRPE